MGNKWTDDEIKFIKDNYHIMTDEELSKHIINHSLSSIISKRKDCGYKRIGNKKYSYEDVKRIMKLHNYVLLTPEPIPFNCSMYIDYICPVHGQQTIQASHLIRDGQGCPECGKISSVSNRRIDIQDREIQENHKKICEKLNLIYVNTIRKPTKNSNQYRIFVEFICKKHKNEGIQSKEKYSLEKSKIPCKYCNHKKLQKDYIIRLAKQGSPHVEILSNDFERINDYVSCKCLIHNSITTKRIRDIILNRSCYYCGLEKTSDLKRLSESEISERISKINKNIIYVGGYCNANTKMKVKCNVCNYEWETYLSTVKFCPNCEHYYTGEKFVENYLIENSIKYIPQKRFDDCRYINTLSFDFYLPDKNICIEYQGQQHYIPIEHFGGEEKFEIQQKRDNIKRNYCKDNHIKLIEISYQYNTQDKVSDFLRIMI